MNDIDRRKRTALTSEDQLICLKATATQQRPVRSTVTRSCSARAIISAGQEKEDIPIGTRFSAKMKKLKVGWVCWQANAPIDQRMGLVVEGFQPERRLDLGDLNKDNWERDSEGEPRDPWQFTNHMVMERVRTVSYTPLLRHRKAVSAALVSCARNTASISGNSGRRSGNRA